MAISLAGTGLLSLRKEIAPYAGWECHKNKPRSQDLKRRHLQRLAAGAEAGAAADARREAARLDLCPLSFVVLWLRLRWSRVKQQEGRRSRSQQYQCQVAGDKTHDPKL